MFSILGRFSENKKNILIVFFKSELVSYFDKNMKH